MRARDESRSRARRVRHTQALQPVARQRRQRLGQRIHDHSGEVLRQRVLMTLRESKADEETELWLRRLRDEAYVEYLGL